MDSASAKSLYISCSYIVTTMAKPIFMRMEGYEVVEKVAQLGGNSARIYVPKKGEGKKVRAILVEE